MLKILHTNDFHGRLTGARIDSLATLRQDADLYFDTGDVIRTGNLGIPLREEPAWSALDQLGCTASVLGNRETHVLANAFRLKLAGSRHPVLCANLRRRDGSFPLARVLDLEAQGMRISVVAVMVAMVTPKMKTQAASAFLWDDPIQTAVELADEKRGRCDVLIALTHVGVRQDERLAMATSKFDMILGGHSHSVLHEPFIVAGTPILQAGSHGRYAGRYDWEPQRGLVRSSLVELPA